MRVISAYRRAQEELRASGFEGDVTEAQVEMAAARTGVDADARRGRSSSSGWRSSRSAPSPPADGRDWSTLLDELGRRGVKLGAALRLPGVAKLEALGIADRFDIVLSAQDPRVHAFKPNPKGLLVALEALAVEPADAVYVGDRAEVDGVGRGRRPDALRDRRRVPAGVAGAPDRRDRRPSPARRTVGGDMTTTTTPRVPPTGGRRAVGPPDAQGPPLDHASGPLVQAGLRPPRHRRRAQRLAPGRSPVGSGAGSSSGSCRCASWRRATT